MFHCIQRKRLRQMRRPPLEENVPTMPAGSPGHPHAPGPGPEFKGGGGSGVVRGHAAAAGIGVTMSSRPPAKPKSKATRAGSVCNGFADMDGEMSI